MRKNADGSPQKSAATSDGVVSRSARSSFRAFSNCIRVLSSGASTVARSAASAASSTVYGDVESHDKVLWAGFDKLEKEDGDTRRVLLLAFPSGFQIWDVEDTENVHVIVSAHDGKASFMQMLPNPINSTALDDRFLQSRPLVSVCGDSSWEENSSSLSSSDNPTSDTVVVSSNVYIYSLKSQSYVHTLKFKATIYSVRCSSRIVAVLQKAQIRCFDAKTLETDYTIVTNGIAYGSLGIGYGPLAVGPRWIAYSGSRIANSSSLASELITLSSSPNIAQLARESSKQLVSGIVSLGDKGYKSFSRYCSEILPNPYIPGLKSIGVVNDNVPDADVGMVIIKDIVSKSVIAQFKAHESAISALCFDPSGMLLVTASIHGHNINVFKIMPSSDENATSFAHLFRLRRGLTNAVIQDISFSNDSNLIVVSSLKGTSHLFEINSEGDVSSPITLSTITKIGSGNSSGVDVVVETVSSVAAAASGMGGGSLLGTITSTFCYCDEKKNYKYYSPASGKSSKTSLLVFDPSGWMTQYALRRGGVGHETAAMRGFNFESGIETEGKVTAVHIQRWPMTNNQSRRETQDHHSDVYGGGTTVDSKSKVFPEVVRKESVEPAWKVTKNKMPRVEDRHQLYISEAELQMHQPSLLPSWAREKFKFQKFVLNQNEESSGGGEMGIEGIQTQTIEARTRDLVPIWGIHQSSRSQQVIRGPMLIPSKITQDDQVATPLESHGTETVHSEEESSRSEEETHSEPVNKEGISEEKIHSEDEDEE